MKIINILGGIGNQMFQYAFLVAMREATGVETCYDASVFKTYSLHHGFELDRRFCITSREASPKEIKKLTFYTTSFFWWRTILKFKLGKAAFEKKHKYTPELLKDKSARYYYGYWQNYRYFDKYKNVLKREFSWKEPMDDKNMNLLDRLSSSNTVSIHIRRGDYLKHPRYCGICELDYYRNAINYVLAHRAECNTFVVFSNDMEWCKENILPLLEERCCIMVDWNQGADSYKDMRLMQSCNVNIIANSSFSWWAAYLNCNSNALVIAPRKWLNDDLNFKPQLEDWILID